VTPARKPTALLKRLTNRVLRSSTADEREARLQRERKKAAAEAQRREHQREDMGSKIHRK
jgi:hypothetical protein